MVISTPAGAADVTGYRPFTKPELVTIFELLEQEAIELPLAAVDLDCFWLPFLKQCSFEQQT